MEAVSPGLEALRGVTCTWRSMYNDHQVSSQSGKDMSCTVISWKRSVQSSSTSKRTSSSCGSTNVYTRLCTHDSSSSAAVAKPSA